MTTIYLKNQHGELCRFRAVSMDYLTYGILVLTQDGLILTEIPESEFDEAVANLTCMDGDVPMRMPHGKRVIGWFNEIV